MKKTFEKFIAVILAGMLLFSILSITTIAQSEIEHPTGLIWDDWDSFDNVLTSSAPITLPSAVDNTLSFPTPGSQGNQGSCVAWAVGYALKSGAEIVKRGWSRTSTAHHFSPAYIYNQRLSGCDTGMTISSALNKTVNQGICSLNYFPYDDSDYNTNPTDLQEAAAAMYEGGAWYKLIDIYSMKQCIANNNGVVIGVKVYSDLDRLSETNQIYDDTSGSSRGAHAICLIGYDDSKNAFKFINSWGTDWGIDGYGWISYDLVNSSDVNGHGAGRGFTLIIPSTDDYILGDINGDGNVSAVDSQMVLRYSSGEMTLTDNQFVIGDVNGDAQVTAVDSRYILQHVAGTITQFPLYD